VKSFSKEIVQKKNSCTIPGTCTCTCTCTITLTCTVHVHVKCTIVRLAGTFFTKKAIFLVSAATVHVGDNKSGIEKFRRKSGQNKMININFRLL
jgi:hypothetical protein